MFKEFKSVTNFSFPFVLLFEITGKDIKSCMFGNIQSFFFFFFAQSYFAPESLT